jgi:hypothetical protein
MTNISRIHIALFAVLAFAAFSGSSQPAHAKNCLSTKVVAAGAKKVTWAGARLSARIAWRHKVQNNHGFMWDTYLLANNKSKRCWKVGARKRCEFGGTPCTLQATGG